MKSKLTKIWGVGLTLALLAGLLMGAVPASAADMGWSAVSAPSAKYNVLVTNEDIDFLAIAPDGVTMFAYSNLQTKLYKSEDGGVTWKGPADGVGDGLNGQTVTAMTISPDYANDSSVVAANATAVFRSINGGMAFGSVAAEGLVNLSGVGTGNLTITSVDCANYYLGGALAIVVGTADAAAGGGVYVFRTDTIAWADQALGRDVFAVAFSPNHQTDSQILAVASDTTDTMLTTKFATNKWGVDTSNCTFSIGTDDIAASEMTSACIAFGEDYEWSANNEVLVGLASTDDTVEDAWRVHGSQVPTPAKGYDLNVGGSTTASDIHSIAASGPIATADVLVGQTNTTTVMRTSDVLASIVSWRPSTKHPSGLATTPNTIVLWSPVGNGVAYAGAGGNTANATGSAVSRSTDGGVCWNQTGLISVSANMSGNITLIDSHVVDASTVFLIMGDTNATAGSETSLFRTTNGGSSWERILMADKLGIVEASPTYATDETVYVAEANDTRIWRSTNGGRSFVGLVAPDPITAFKLIDKDNYFVAVDHAGTARVYRSARWNYGTVRAAKATSIALSTDFAEDDTIYVGTDDGCVYTSNNASATPSGVEYRPVGGVGELTAVVGVAVDPDYVNNSTIYAASSSDTVGVRRFVVGTSAIWKQVATVNATGLAISADGTIYASSTDANSGIARELGPSGPPPYFYTCWMTNDLPTGASMQNVGVGSASNVLYATASGVAAGSYGYNWRLLTFNDTLAVGVEAVSPKDGTTTSGTKVDLSWKGLVAPMAITYHWYISTDEVYANVFADGTVPESGTGVTVTALTPGETYWWHVRAEAAGADAMRSRWSPSWTFSPKLGVTGTTSLTTAPGPGATNVSLRPTFQWESVAGADSYEMELADNPFFANADVKKPLTHTTWTWDKDLEYETTYYWRVRAVRGGNLGPWSEATFTTMAVPVPPEPTVITPPAVTVTPAPVPPAPAPEVVVQPAIPPTVLWAIIVIGAVLVIAVIVLIVRTRRIP